MKEPSPLIIAHRGESFDAPENTMASINLAWERGAEAVEIDLQLSKDLELVVIHDLNTKRLAGLNKNVKDQPLDELRRLDVGIWKDIQFSGEKIPVLEEVSESVPFGKKLIIELKSGPEIVPVLKTKMKYLNLKSDQIEFIGFDLKTMIKTKAEFQNHKVLWLLNLDFNLHTRLFGTSITKGIAIAKNNGLDGLNVWAGKMLNKKMIDQIHEAGLLAYCWTVNEIKKAKELSEWGINAITTDKAEWLKKHIYLPL